MNPEHEPKLTFWSVPPFRQRLRAVANSLTLRQVRFLIAELYGMFYLLFAIKVPVIFLIATHAIGGSSPTAVNLFGEAVRFLIPAAALCAIVGALFGGAVAWHVTGRALRSRRLSRVRCALCGALGTTLPMVSLVPAAPPQQLPIAAIALVVLWLFGAGLGLGFHWVVQRDRTEQPQES
ncbi:MAG: hypothetical protein HY290_10920 [Planctomycetia bacterium]|nr:hypothetical protein [Planctomycetia bacterium]